MGERPKEPCFVKRAERIPVYLNNYLFSAMHKDYGAGVGGRSSFQPIRIAATRLRTCDLG